MYDPHPDTWESPPKKKNPVFASVVPRQPPDETLAPGPGQYDVPRLRPSKRPSIHTARSEKVNNVMVPPSIETPAPDVYQTGEDMTGKRGRSIGRESRFMPSKQAMVPGPGSYELGGTLIKRSFNAELARKEKNP
jgi:hypothetical protein